MKTWLNHLLVLLALVAGLAQTARATVAFTLAPAAASNTYSGKITLQITGLTNTETVVIQKFFDANGNGVIDAGEVAVQQFNLTDGQAGQVIGGVTNSNVPGDTDGTANGSITAKLLFQFASSPMAAGNYLYKLSSPSGHFPPLTNSFTVTNFPYAQKFTGTVFSNSVAVPYASVLLFQGSGHDLTPIAGAVADNAGVYTIPAPTGTYLLVAFKSRCYASTTAAANLALGPGATVSTNLNLLAATQTISGQVKDASSGAGLPGLLVPVQAKDGFLGICYTDTNGNFTAGVDADQWYVQDDSAGTAVLGYVGLQNKVAVNTTTGSVANVSIALPKATALFYGTVLDNLGNPLPQVVAVYASDNNNGLYQADGYTDAAGNFVTAAVGGLGNDPWQVQVDNASSFPNDAFSQPAFQQNGGTNLGVGQAVPASLTAILATNQITGNVKDNHGANIAVVGVTASATIDGAYFFQYVDTDANGNYSLPVASGSWTVALQCQGGSDSLSQLGSYECPNGQNDTIAGNNATNNFVVQPCAGLAITTPSPLPGGSVNSPYSIQFQGSSCGGNLNWSVGDPQDLPPGLSLYSGGALSGTPSSSGTYHFTVNVNDGNGNSTGVSFSLSIAGVTSGPLLITTASLPDGIVGGTYNQTLIATGGQPAYTWSLTPGSLDLPGGMYLSTGGVISGTPTNAPFGGTTYYFSVRVTDRTTTTADQLLSLTIYPTLTIATNALPGGTLGVAYNAQVLVSGGDPFGSGGYSSFITSGSPPPGLNIVFGATTSSNQVLVISGTPTSSGTFTFTLGASDADSNTAQYNYSITISPPSLQITTTSLSNAIAGVAYTNQLQGSNGATPYTWTIANGSQPLPSALTLSPSGLISGVPAASGTNYFIVRLTDHNALTTTRALTLITNPKPQLGSAARLSSTQFQLLLSGVAGQNYTLQMTTNLGATNWASLFTTNSATTNAFMLVDPNATNQQRYYRILIGP